MGVGGGAMPGVYPAYGLRAERRASPFAEGVALMRRLWTEPRVTFEGEFWRLDNTALQPKPLRRPHPPLWFGARHPAALRRAVELGQGFIGAGSIASGQFAEEVRTLQGFLQEVGRDPAGFAIGKRVYIAVDGDRDRARRRLVEWFGPFYRRPELAERVSVWGTPAECLEGLAPIVEAGARLLILNPVFDRAGQLERIGGWPPSPTSCCWTRSSPACAGRRRGS